MPHKSYREESRKNYGQDSAPDEGLTLDQLNAGALLRIADASEAMARNHNELIEDLERERRWRKDAERSLERERRAGAAYRGHIKRLKRELEEARAAHG